MIDIKTKACRELMSLFDRLVDMKEAVGQAPDAAIHITQEQYMSLKREANVNPTFRAALRNGTYRGVRLSRLDR